ncbi:hypothetical protein HZC53_01725 [Candidatus Uhrbacteria bacterium]|nr:hypothetical protein [Candidatus Uhrbacteria bacterium]
MPKSESELIELPICRKLSQPSTEQDSIECLRIIASLRAMEIEVCRLLQHCDMPAVYVRYRGGKTPARGWNKWLWSRIMPEGSDFCWLGRLAAINQSARELILIPRPDKIDVSLAENARQRATEAQPIHLVLGLVYPPHQYMRSFYSSLH